jgi:hypothetical protein
MRWRENNRIEARRHEGADYVGLRQSGSEKLDLLLQLFELAIEDALVLIGMGVLDAAANVAALKFEPFDLGDNVRFRIVNRAHDTPPRIAPSADVLILATCAAV